MMKHAAQGTSRLGGAVERVIRLGAVLYLLRLCADDGGGGALGELVLVVCKVYRCVLPGWGGFTTCCCKLYGILGWGDFVIEIKRNSSRYIYLETL